METRKIKKEAGRLNQSVFRRTSVGLPDKTANQDSFSDDTCRAAVVTVHPRGKMEETASLEENKTVLRRLWEGKECQGLLEDDTEREVRRALSEVGAPNLVLHTSNGDAPLQRSLKCDQWAKSGGT